MFLLAISIDTEADTGPDWVGQTPESYRNLERLSSALLPLTRRFRVPVTLLLSGDVIARDAPAEICARLEREEGWELGTHLHGEFEPPQMRYAGPAGVRLREVQAAYTAEVEREKMRSLTEKFVGRFGRQPAAFRGGRYGATARTLDICLDLGYAVDSSVVPGQLWWEDGTRLDFTGFDVAPCQWRRGARALVEIPITVRPGRLPLALNRRLTRLSAPTPGAAASSRLARRALRKISARLWRPVWLRPSYSSARQMCDVLRWLARHGRQSPVVANIMFHSSELLAGASPYNRTEDDVAGFLERLGEALCCARSLGFTAATLTQAAKSVKDLAPSAPIQEATPNAY